MTPVRKSDLISEEVEETGELVLIDRATEAVVVLNGAAAAVWYLCDGTRTIAQIAREIRDILPAAPGDRVEAEVGAIVEDLRVRRVLEVRG